eukprot:12345223-Alexandrium_andersonii.AAC.1
MAACRKAWQGPGGKLHARGCGSVGEDDARRCRQLLRCACVCVCVRVRMRACARSLWLKASTLP